ncbi:MAG: hypothetical protein RRB13_12360 [bacterium]|nr:hypothetical protein [bacterium]
MTVLKNPEFKGLSEADREMITELSSAFVVSKTEEDFRGVMERLRRKVPFTHWGCSLARLANEYEATSNYISINNFAPVFMEAYRANAAEFFDVIVLYHFKEQGFGALQRWEETFKDFEGRKEEADPLLFKKHLAWRAFLDEFNMMLDGYSIGSRSHLVSGEHWFGSIINYADDLEYNPRTEAIFRALVDAQHASLVRILKPRLDEAFN